jgi:hypothetical protein
MEIRCRNAASARPGSTEFTLSSCHHNRTRVAGASAIACRHTDRLETNFQNDLRGLAGVPVRARKKFTEHMLFGSPYLLGSFDHAYATFEIPASLCGTSDTFRRHACILQTYCVQKETTLITVADHRLGTPVDHPWDSVLDVQLVVACDIQGLAGEADKPLLQYCQSLGA